MNGMPETLIVGGRRYEILERLGSGDRIRLRAVERQAGPQGRQRTIHVLPRSRDTQQHLRVLERLANSRNANVPFLISSQVQGDSVYIVSEWMAGQSLADYLREVRNGRTERPSVFNACRLIRGQAHGLCQLHSSWDVHHGDIKPENLILSPGGTSLATIDFGSAWLGQRTSSRGTGDGASGVYSPPELLDASCTPDFRADQFSLSVVWYELMTLTIPYDGAGGRAGVGSMRKVFAEKLAPPSRTASQTGVPRGLMRLIDKTVCRGLALDPAGRFPSPRDWLNALDDIHHEFRRRRRLGGINRVVTNWLEKIVGYFSNRGDKDTTTR